MPPMRCSRRSAANSKVTPDNWRRWYRLARAYDYAGDRSRARETMKKAVEMQERTVSKTLLVVHHTPSPATRELLEAVLAGTHDPDIEGVDIEVRPALAATVPDMLDADGYLFGTTANLGYMSGALKHFFDTVYYPSLDHVAGRPYGLWVHGNNDTVGRSQCGRQGGHRARAEQGRRRARSRRRHRRRSS